MASTYSWLNALTIAGTKFPLMTSEGYAGILCDLANSFIWNFADWRETIAELPPFWISPLEQDYGYPLSTIPSDFHGLREAWLIQISSADVPQYFPMNIRENVDFTTTQSLPKTLAYVPDKNVFRIFPRPSANIGPSEYMVHGRYKKTPTVLTQANIGNTKFAWKDQYLHTVVNTLVWKYFELLGDERQGQIVWNNAGQRQASGQAARALALLDIMANQEGVAQGPRTVAPEEPLVMY